MPRKKERIVSLEVVEPNSTWDYRETRLLTNFICKAEDAEKTIREMMGKEYQGDEESFSPEVKSILAPAGTRNASTVFFTEDVNVEEVKLPTSVKAGTKYVYKVYDYSGDKTTAEYGTQKDALAYISKKIKSKYVYVTSNGQSRRIEYSPKVVTDILNELEDTTSQFEIESIGRTGVTNEMYLITIFKNYM